MPAGPDVTKVTVNMLNTTLQALEAIAKERGITKTDAIQQLIKYNKFMLDQEEENAKILIERPDGRFERIIRR